MSDRYSDTVPCGCLGSLLANVLDQERGHHSQYHADSIAMSSATNPQHLPYVQKEFCD